MTDSDGQKYTDLRKKAMQLKDNYIKGHGLADKSYLKFFNEAEEVLGSVGIAAAAQRDMELVNHLDVDFIVTRRRANAEILRSAFSNWLVFLVY